MIAFLIFVCVAALVAVVLNRFVFSDKVVSDVPKWAGPPVEEPPMVPSVPETVNIPDLPAAAKTTTPASFNTYAPLVAELDAVTKVTAEKRPYTKREASQKPVAKRTAAKKAAKKGKGTTATRGKVK